MKAQALFLKTISALHVGSGSDVGIIDLPIQREIHTDFPKIEASTLKGCFRREFEKKDSENKLDIETVFGKQENAGSISFSDARILFFPVKSASGIFAYITCPYVLKRFQEDMSFCKNIKESFNIPNINLKDSECFVFGNNANKIDDKYAILEEFRFDVKEEITGDYISIPNLDIDKTRVVIVSDSNFKEFVKNSTEVATRIKIGKDGVVAKGALFTEEYLPAESYMYSLVMFDKLHKEEKIIKEIQNSNGNKIEYMQIGGNSTLGKGVVKIFYGDKQ